MDRSEKWCAYLADIKTVFEEWERRHRGGMTSGRRFREINSICRFALCLENNENKRYLLGFQERGIAEAPVRVSRLFDNDFGEIEDVDVILVPDLGPEGPAEREVHRCQLVSYVNQPNPSTTDLIAFLERKKFLVPRDDDLILIVHIEQPMKLDFVKLSIEIQMRRPMCPYSQVFVFGQSVGSDPPRWIAMLVFPRFAPLKELDGPTARTVLADRHQLCVPPSDVSKENNRGMTNR